MEETKVIYYNNEVDDMPYLIKLNVAPDKACLRDFKQSLCSGAGAVGLTGSLKSYKFFFQTVIEGFGTVKEELCDDDAPLPCINGRVIGWLVSVDGSQAGSDNKSQASSSVNGEQHRNNNIHNNDENDSTQQQQPQQYHQQQHFSSMQSISSNGSSSNNENQMTSQVVRRSKTNSLNHHHQHHVTANNYESMTSRKNSINSKQGSNQRQLTTPLK
jgi:hypothetical protein